MTGNGSQNKYPGQEYINSLNAALQTLQDELQAKAEQNQEGYRKLLDALNRDKIKNKKENTISEPITSFKDIFNIVLDEGSEKLQSVINKTFKRTSATPLQASQIDFLKDLAGIEISGFLTNLLNQSIEIARDTLLPNLWNIISQGIQQAVSRFSTKITNATSQSMPLHITAESIESAARYIYEQSPTIAVALHNALNTNNPDKQQSQMLREFYNAIQAQFQLHGTKPSIDLIKDVVDNLHFTKSLIANSLKLIPSTNKLQERLLEEFQKRVEAFQKLGMGTENAVQAVSDLMQKANENGVDIKSLIDQGKNTLSQIKKKVNRKHKASQPTGKNAKVKLAQKRKKQ